MTLRLALRIDGDAEGAKKALDDTAQGIENLGRKSEGTAKNAERAGSAVGNLGSKAKESGAALAKTGSESERAATGIATVGGAADAAHGRVGALAAGLAGLVSGLAIGALVSAFAALAASAVRWVGAILDNEGRINAALETQEGLIGRIGQKYRDAARGVHDYGAQSAAVQKLQLEQNLPRLESGLSREARAATSGAVTVEPPGLSDVDIRAGVGEIAMLSDGITGVAEKFSAFRGPLEEFHQGLARGTPDVIKLRTEVALLASALDANDPAREAATQLLDMTNKAALLQAELARGRDLLAGYAGDTEAAARALGTLPAAFQGAGAAARAEAQSLAAFRAELDQLSGGGSGGSGSSGGASSGGAGGEAPDVPFDSGGFTGSGGRHEPAGIVHRGEFVFSAPAVDRIGLSHLDRLHRGYAEGGLVGGAIGAARGAVGGLARQLVAGKPSVDDFSNAVQGLTRRLMDMLVDKGVSGIFNALLGGLGGGSGILAGIGHQGATIGAARTTRRVHPAYFDGAPRLHSGGDIDWAAGERPFIGMLGEKVGWPKDLAREYGGGQTAVNNFYDQRSFHNMTAGDIARVDALVESKKPKWTQHAIREMQSQRVSNPRTFSGGG